MTAQRKRPQPYPSAWEAGDGASRATGDLAGLEVMVIRGLSRRIQGRCRLSFVVGEPRGDAMPSISQDTPTTTSGIMCDWGWQRRCGGPPNPAIRSIDDLLSKYCM